MPLGFEAGDANLYRYVTNNPANDADPSGLVGGTRHHAYPLFVGGSNNQPAFVLESVDAHNRAHNFLARNGIAVQNPQRARAVWLALSEARRRELIIGSLRAAGVPDNLIRSHIDAVMAGARPGFAVRRIAGYPGGLIRVIAATARPGLRIGGMALRAASGVLRNPWFIAISEMAIFPPALAGGVRLSYEQLEFPPGGSVYYFLPRGTFITPRGQIYIPLPESEFGQSDFQPPPGSLVVVRSDSVRGSLVRPGATYPPDSVRPVSPLALLIPIGMTEETARLEYSRYLQGATGNSAGQTPNFMDWLRRTYPNPERPR
jgi:hypothetical protein